MKNVLNYEQLFEVDTMYSDHRSTIFPYTVKLVIVACLALLCGFHANKAFAQGNTSAFIDGIAVGSSWRDVTSSEGKHLRIHYEAVAYSGGGTANGRTVVFGGGHNNGMNDAVAILDWRRFETVGWTEELISTADHIGVSDTDFAAIGSYLNENYNPSTPGGILDDRGAVALSRHTYDHIVVRDNHFYMFSGVLPFDHPGQPNEPWRNKEGDIWRYDFGQGWTFVDAPLPRGFVTGHAAAAHDSLTGNIWVHEENGLRLFNTSNESTGPVIDFLNSQEVESFLNFNPEKGLEGTLFGAGTYAGRNWHEYDIAAGAQSNMGAVPGNVANTYIIYVDSSFGPDYGTYFAFVPQDGTLRRWNGSGWDTIATGGPRNNDYVYGRAGFEEVHQVFYWIHNPYTNNSAWQTNVVRPYAFDGNSEPRPTVSISADPDTVAPQGTSTLTWTSSNATSCAASGDWSGARNTSGNQVVGPLVSDETYTITCSGDGGTSSDSLTVAVVASDPPPTLNLSADPAFVDAGGFSVLSWSSANADSCTADGEWSGSKSVQGSESVGPIDSTSQFGLTCSGAGGDIRQSVTVSVNLPPPPTLQFSADPTSVDTGGGSTLAWSSTNADSCIADGDWTGSKSVQGTESVGPLNATSQFGLSCSGAGGDIRRTVTVSVDAPPPPPAPTLQFSAAPTSVDSSGSSTLTWSSTNADSCTADGDWSGSKSVQGNQSVGPLNETSQFGLSCSGAGGEIRRSLTVSVNVPPTPASPTLQLSADPASVVAGGTSMLSWSSTNANTCTADGDWSGSKSIQGSRSMGPIDSTSEYGLTCSGAGGDIRRSVTVSVTAAPAPPPPPPPGGDDSPPTVEKSGSGAVGWQTLIVLLILGVARRRFGRV